MKIFEVPIQKKKCKNLHEIIIIRTLNEFKKIKL